MGTPAGWLRVIFPSCPTNRGSCSTPTPSVATGDPCAGAGGALPVHPLRVTADGGAAGVCAASSRTSRDGVGNTSCRMKSPGTGEGGVGDLLSLRYLGLRCLRLRCLRLRRGWLGRPWLEHACPPDDGQQYDDNCDNGDPPSSPIVSGHGCLLAGMLLPTRCLAGKHGETVTRPDSLFQASAEPSQRKLVESSGRPSPHAPFPRSCR